MITRAWKFWWAYGTTFSHCPCPHVTRGSTLHPSPQTPQCSLSSAWGALGPWGFRWRHWGLGEALIGRLQSLELGVQGNEVWDIQGSWAGVVYKGIRGMRAQEQRIWDGQGGWELQLSSLALVAIHVKLQQTGKYCWHKGCQKPMNILSQGEDSICCGKRLWYCSYVTVSPFSTLNMYSRLVVYPFVPTI